MEETQEVINYMFSDVSFDLTPIMHLAVNTNDREWFDQLCERMSYYRRFR